MNGEFIDKTKVVEFYDRIYKSGREKSMRTEAHYKRVFELLKPVKDKAKSLDIGCGTGYFLKAAAEAGLEVYGLDISPEAIEISKSIAPSAKVICGSGEELPFENNFFDYIFFCGTLEHFLDPEKGLLEAIRVAKRDATFLIIVPNKNYWLWKMRGESGTNQVKIKELLLDEDGWIGLFGKYNLTPIKIFHDPWPRESVPIFKFKNPWRIFRRALYQFIWLFIPLKSTYQFVFVCRRKL